MTCENKNIWSSRCLLPGVFSSDRRIIIGEDQLEDGLCSSWTEDQVCLHHGQEPDLPFWDSLLARQSPAGSGRVHWRYMRTTLNISNGTCLSVIRPLQTPSLCLNPQMGRCSLFPVCQAPRNWPLQRHLKVETGNRRGSTLSSSGKAWKRAKTLHLRFSST